MVRQLSASASATSRLDCLSGSYAAKAEATDEADDDTIPTITLSGDMIDDAWHIEKLEEEYYITGAKIEKFAARTDFANVHSVNRLRDIMKKRGIMHELSRQGADGSSLLRIGDSSTFTLRES